jgi:hypothetical protein
MVCAGWLLFLTLTHCGSLVHRPAMVDVYGLARQSNQIIAREERDGLKTSASGRRAI